MATDSLPRPAGSELEEALLEHISRHIEGERDLLAAYAKLADESEDEYVRYLARLILEDESRHHRLLIEMKNRVQTDVTWREVTPQLPRLTIPSHREALIEETERYIEQEERDAAELRRLRRQMRPLKDTTLLSLIVELMEIDSAKHLRILDFLRRTATID